MNPCTITQGKQVDSKWSIVLKAILGVVVLKVMLIPSYHSTDFEVHRNWLALTHSLPATKWYYESTSEWTLDYPPLFAWFEWFLSQFADYFDPNMLLITNLNYASDRTILFQRCTVILSDFVLIAAVFYYLQIGQSKSHQKLLTFILLLFFPGMIIVDHIHFQYNGYLIGLLLISVAFLQNDHPLLAAFAYSVCMNSKHLFCFQAPVFLVYLLSTYCVSSRQSFSILHFLELGGIVLSVFFMSLFPILKGNVKANLLQFLSRLFPFQRGLLHSYWAPNIWSLYAGLDRFLAFVARRGCSSFSWMCTMIRESNTADGKVGNVCFSILPNIPSWLTILLMLLSYCPVLYRLWKKPTKQMLLQCLLLTTFLYFLIGWHVHEKAILPTVLLAGLLLWSNENNTRLFLLFSISATIGLFPLLFITRDWITQIILLAAYLAGLLYSMTIVYGSIPTFTAAQKGCIVLLTFAVFFASILCPVFLSEYSFLPLMVISMSCAIVNSYLFCQYYAGMVSSSSKKEE